MSDTGSRNGPERSTLRLTAAESEEKGHIGYLLDAIESLKERGIVPAEVAAGIAAEYAPRLAALIRGGQFRALLETARERRARGDRTGAIALARQAAELEPTRPGGWELLAWLLNSDGRREEALAVLDEAAGHGAAVEIVLPAVMGPAAKTGSKGVPSLDGAHEAGPPPVSWGSIVGAFVEDHGQKLILGLAVLLIVVSSTIGAHHVLGDRLLWSSGGKCLVALVYTALIAGFGLGLSRWGAHRAGRIMLVTSLLVHPINFSLAAQLRLISALDATRLAIFALVMIVLALLCWFCTAALAMRRGRACAFFTLSALNAVAVGDVPFGLPYATLIAAGFVLLGATWFGRSRPGPEGAAEEEPGLVLGLLGFAYLFLVVRVGAFTLGLIPDKPSLLAVPVMLGAVSTVRASRAVGKDAKARDWSLGARFAGLALAGLAFALALAHPPLAGPLLSGSTLATALLGLGLFAALLRAERHPAYLYLAFGALFVAYFGTHFFVRDLMRQVLHAAGQALGYRGRLPEPFKAINGAVFNLVLAGLSSRFRRAWNDERLAWHCHAIGLPLAVGACVFSAFEPKAAVICLPLYVVLFGLGAWRFAAPRLLHLACASATGAVYFGTSLALAPSVAGWAIAAVALAIVFEGVATLLARLAVPASYQAPLRRGSVALCAAALGLCAWGRLGADASEGLWARGERTIALTAALGGLVVVSRRFTTVPVAILTLTTALGAWLAGVEWVLGTGRAPAAVYGLLLGTFGLGMLGALVATRRRDAPQLVLLREVAPHFLRALIVGQVVFVLAGAVNGPFVLGALVAAGLLAIGTTAIDRDPALVHIGLALMVGAALCGSALLTGWDRTATTLAGMALTGGLAMPIAWGLSRLGRKWGLSEFHTEPCVSLLAPLAIGSSALALSAWSLALATYPIVVTALVAIALGLLLLAVSRGRSEATYGAIAALVTSVYLVLLSVGDPDAAHAWALGLVAAYLSLGLWVLGWFAGTRLGPPWIAIFGRPAWVSSVVMLAPAILLGHGSTLTMLLVALGFVLSVRAFPSTGWLYGAVAALAAAVYDGVLRERPGTSWVIAATLGAWGLWGLSRLVERGKPLLANRLGAIALDHETPLWHSAVLVAGLGVVLALTGVVLGPISLACVGMVSALYARMAWERRNGLLANLASVTWALFWPVLVLVIHGTDRSPLVVNLAAGAGVLASGALLLAARRPGLARFAEGIEAVGFACSLLGVAPVLSQGTLVRGNGAAAVVGALVLVVVAGNVAWLAWRRRVEWPIYLAQLGMLGAYGYGRLGVAASAEFDALAFVILGYLDFALADLLGRLNWGHVARPVLRASFVMPLVPLAMMLWRGLADDTALFVLLGTSAFYLVAGARLREKRWGYVAAVLFNVLLWVFWSRVGWRLSDHVPYYFVPIGLSLVLFAEAQRRELGRSSANTARLIGLSVIYAALFVPVWQFDSLGAWLAMLVISLVGVFVGIGLRAQVFLWLGLVCFVLSVVYQLGRVGMDHTLARWGIMLGLGVALVLFVALNEKRRALETLRKYYDQVRLWE